MSPQFPIATDNAAQVFPPVRAREKDMIKTTLLAAILACSVPFAGTCFALDKPAGEVILRVTGNVATPNDGETAAFDREMLAELPGRKATMETPWTKGAVSFEGPLLREVLKAAGAEGKVIKVKAMNDYSADVPISDVNDYETILAERMDGKPMSVREKGPLFLIYPFDKNPELYNEKYFSRSVWQIVEIEVVN